MKLDVTQWNVRDGWDSVPALFQVFTPSPLVERVYFGGGPGWGEEDPTREGTPTGGVLCIVLRSVPKGVDQSEEEYDRMFDGYDPGVVIGDLRGEVIDLDGLDGAQWELRLASRLLSKEQTMAVLGHVLVAITKRHEAEVQRIRERRQRELPGTSAPAPIVPVRGVIVEGGMPKAGVIDPDPRVLQRLLGGDFGGTPVFAGNDGSKVIAWFQTEQNVGTRRLVTFGAGRSGLHIAGDLVLLKYDASDRPVPMSNEEVLAYAPTTVETHPAPQVQR